MRFDLDIWLMISDIWYLIEKFFSCKGGAKVWVGAICRTASTHRGKGGRDHDAPKSCNHAKSKSKLMQIMPNQAIMPNSCNPAKVNQHSKVQLPMQYLSSQGGACRGWTSHQDEWQSFFCCIRVWISWHVSWEIDDQLFALVQSSWSFENYFVNVFCIRLLLLHTFDIAAW